MTQKELSRVSIMEKLQAKQLTQKKAGVILNITSRQIRRLLKKYTLYGAAGLVSKRRGKPSNNKIDPEVKQRVLQLTREKYIDFGPTFLREKLYENHNIRIGKETLRQWMIEDGIWKSKRRRQAQIHQSRERRDCIGELVQIDGSPHDWFEGRGEKCCLLVFVDDASSEIKNMRFEESETTAGYFRTFGEYINKFGLPMALYSDKNSIFRVNMPESKKTSVTQFERAIDELGVEGICANSAQAKGRVERLNGILQDRLVKEMRLLGISDMETANKYLPEFIEKYNKKFAVQPKNNEDAHVKFIGNEEQLNLILCFKTERKLSKNLEMSYKNVIYQIKTTGQGYGLRYAKITVCEDLEGKVTLVYRDKKLNYSCYKKRKKTAEIVGAKELNSKINKLTRKSSKPSVNHPWRQYKKLPKAINLKKGAAP